MSGKAVGKMSQPAAFGGTEVEELPNDTKRAAHVKSSVWPVLERVEAAAGSLIRPEIMPHEDFAARENLKHDIAMMLKK